MKIKIRILLWMLAAALGMAAVATTLWVRRFHRYTPVEALLDLQAAAKVKGSARPVEDFLEARYGPMSDPVNRQRAFLDFFNLGHIEGMHILVSHMDPSRKQTHITAMAQWIARYRTTMTPAEKAALAAWLRSEVGRSSLQEATARYLQQDIHFRAATAPVIQELMTTLATVQGP